MNPTTEGTTPATSSGSSGSVNSTSTTSHATMDPILAKQQKIPSVTTSGATIAATATTTATTTTNNALHPMMDALQTSETAMSTSTPSWQLPHSSEGMVPLRLLIDRLTAKAYTDLQNLVEIMPGMPDSERKRHLLDYIVQTRQAFIRLLVLVRWAANASNIQRCQDIMGYLRQQSHQFGGAVHTLWVLHQTFHRPNCVTMI
ncbi:mediator complex subunit MED14-domain-containing protein [Syncephalis plumigaleata]|nr:mediator complex subunit MED14-domain-containing protein [Syncephalis plumigaleata]